MIYYRIGRFNLSLKLACKKIMKVHFYLHIVIDFRMQQIVMLYIF